MDSTLDQKNDGHDPMTTETPSCCCSTLAAAPPSQPPRMDRDWVDGAVDSAVGPIPRIKTILSSADRVGAWKVRWGLGRGRFRVEPGLYAVGSPASESPVLISANYKMSFDLLRSQLSRRDAWIVVLDTRGVNVWCAAGKGTFGTEELIHRISAVGLDQVVAHRKLIVPQLGAPGVSAHRVKSESGFRVVYGPVNAADLPAFLDAGLRATPAMRQVRFGLRDRCVLIPIELIPAVKQGLPAAALLTVLSGLGEGGFSLSRLASPGLANGAILLCAWIFGAVTIPLLVPWLPGRSFSAKGVWVGLLYVLIAALLVHDPGGGAPNWAAIASWLLVVPAVTSFLAMNFTGATPFTSLSGVLREMRVAIPLQIGSAAAGLILWILSLYI